MVHYVSQNKDPVCISDFQTCNNMVVEHCFKGPHYHVSSFLKYSIKNLSCLISELAYQNNNDLDGKVYLLGKNKKQSKGNPQQNEKGNLPNGEIILKIHVSAKGLIFKIFKRTHAIQWQKKQTI